MGHQTSPGWVTALAGGATQPCNSPLSNVCLGTSPHCAPVTLASLTHWPRMTVSVERTHVLSRLPKHTRQELTNTGVRPLSTNPETETETYYASFSVTGLLIEQNHTHSQAQFKKRLSLLTFCEVCTQFTCSSDDTKPVFACLWYPGLTLMLFPGLHVLPCLVYPVHQSPDPNLFFTSIFLDSWNCQQLKLESI